LYYHFYPQCMYIHKNYIKPTTSWRYVGYPVTDKLYALLIAYIISLKKKACPQAMISIPSFIISFTVIRSQLYFANSPATIFSEPALCRLHTIPRPCVTFHIKLIFYGELSAPCPTPNLEDQPLLAVCNCLFHIFTFTLCIWRPSPQSATQRQAILWQQGSTQHRQLSDCLDKKQCMSYEPLCSSNQRKLYKRQIAKLLLMSW
jgi:hypothetical protein